jgi:regulator of replication initiation timing
MKAEKEKLAAQLKDLELAVDELKKKVPLTESIAPPALKEEAKTAEETKKAQESENKENEKPDDKKEAKKAESKKEPTKTDVKDVYLTGYQAFKEGKEKPLRQGKNSCLCSKIILTMNIRTMHVSGWLKVTIRTRTMKTPFLYMKNF